MEQTEQSKKHIAFDLGEFSAGKQEELAQMYENTLKQFTEGSIVTGRIIEKRANEAIVDIGYKSEGAVPAEEFEDFEAVKAGDAIEVLIEQIENEDGRILISKQKAEQKKMWESVLASSGEGSTVEGKICSKVKGGLIVDVKGIKAFLPGSQLDIAPVHNIDDFLGKRFEFRVTKINRDRHNIVLSRRELLEQRRRERRKQLLAELKIGQIRPGTVKNITDFGAFIDIGGLDGLLHVTDMSWGRTSHPSKVVKIGDTVEVMILDIDYEKERVSLGLKQKTPNPWDNIEQRYPVGTKVHGRVVNLAPYGAFIEIEPGVEGLVHVSEISWVQRVNRASDVLNVGDEVDAVILNINPQEQKISLGIRQTQENPWEKIKEKYPVGARLKGTVRNFTSYGAFVELPEGIDGMIHVTDMSWTRKVSHPSEVLKKGEEVEVIVLDIDSANQRVSLGLKQTQQDPWENLAERYKIGQRVTGKVSKLATFGAFIELEEGIDGLVHISQISDEHVEKVGDALKVGQQVEARIIKIDPLERRIGLSIKAAQLPDEEFELKEEMLTGLKPGSELVDLASALDEAFNAAGVDADWRPGAGKKNASDSRQDAAKAAPEGKTEAPPPEQSASDSAAQGEEP